MSSGSPKGPMMPYSSNSSTALASNSAWTTRQNLIVTSKPPTEQSRVHAKENDKPIAPLPRESQSYRYRIYHHQSYPASSALPLFSETLSLPPYLPDSKIPRFLTRSHSFWLSLYFVFNLTLTLYNKLVLVRFPFPYTLTALHTLLGVVGGNILARTGFFSPVRLSLRETMVLVAFSILYTVNIAVSNVSLQLVTVAFHQVVRAATPIFTLFFCQVLLGTSSSRAKIISLTPVVAGVALATYGDYYFTTWGLTLTLLGTVLAAFKTILTNVLQTVKPVKTTDSPLSLSSLRSLSFPRLHPLALLYLLSPLAFLECIFLSYYSGELDQVRYYVAREMTPVKCFGLLLNGFLAFGLNVVSFSANKKVGALSMTVAANVKQALTIVCGVLLFELHITTTNALGILLTIVGGATYAYVEFLESESRKI